MTSQLRHTAVLPPSSYLMPLRKYNEMKYVEFYR